jgi:hypothetical protein
MYQLVKWFFCFLGFVTAKLDDGRTGNICIVGPKCALPCSMNIDRADVEKINIIWIGRSDAEDVRLPPVTHMAAAEDPRKLWIEKLSVYYGVNRGSLFALLGQLFLNMNVKDLVRNGFKLASAHIIGEMGTGT